MYCCTPKALYNHVGGGGSLLNHHQCAASTWIMLRLPQDNGTSALTTHRLQVEKRESHRTNQVYALTTHQLQVERRESIDPIKCMRSPLTSYRLRGERVTEAIQVDALTTPPATGVRGEESHRAIKCMRSPHSYRWRGESHRANQVDALTTHQLQVERRESHRANQVDALATHSYRWRGESHRAIQVYAPHTPATDGEEREIEPIKWMHSPHTSYR